MRVPGEARIWDSALGPDGLGWFNAGSAIARVDAAGAISPIAAPADTAEPLAAGPDGTAWFMTRDGAFAHLAPSGATTTAPPLVVAGCPDVFARAIERAADGAMWIANNCGLVRIAPDGSTRLVKLEGRATDFAADSAGGMWFASIFREGVGHVDAAGNVLRSSPRATGPTCPSRPTAARGSRAGAAG